MKKIVLLWIVLLTGLSPDAQVLSPGSLNEAATLFIQSRQPGNLLQSCESLMNEQKVPVGYLFRFAPAGFIIVSANEKIKPVYAYSADGSFDLPGAEKESLKRVISKDLQSRILTSDKYSVSVRDAVRQEWTSFLSGSRKSKLFEQWPPEGATSTGGWLESNWTQTFPYNEMCPMDLNTGTRSYAGCPAVAMAQILNYHREINQTRFGPTDDYYHGFGTGYNFWIDDDYQMRDFPCFDTLNLWLDTLESAYLVNGPLSGSLKAALCFACGVAAHQCYSSVVSGTYGMDQALMSYKRFGYSESRLVFPEDTTLNSLIAENVKVKLPVHLGLLSSTGSGGHNVVVDGYNTDEFYHFNFGWGGPANGWYTLPPSGIPYSLTIIESAALDIKSELYTGVPETQSASPVRLYPNPVNEVLQVAGLTGPATFSVYTLSGKQVLNTRLSGRNCRVNMGEIPSGGYIYKVTPEMGNGLAGKLIKN